MLSFWTEYWLGWGNWLLVVCTNFSSNSGSNCRKFLQVFLEQSLVFDFSASGQLFALNVFLSLNWSSRETFTPIHYQLQFVTSEPCIFLSFRNFPQLHIGLLGGKRPHLCNENRLCLCVNGTIKVTLGRQDPCILSWRQWRGFGPHCTPGSPKKIIQGSQNKHIVSSFANLDISHKKQL